MDNVHPWTEALFALAGPSWVSEIADGVSIGMGVWLPQMKLVTGIQWVF